MRYPRRAVGLASLDPVPPTEGRVVGVGDRGRVTFALDPSLPAGTWHAEVVLRSGTVERDAEGELVVPEPGDTTHARSTRARQATFRRGCSPWRGCCCSSCWWR